jgi:hypothetical protein
MQDDMENDGTITINAQELLTAKDCEPIIRSDGCLVGYAWPPAAKPSATMLKHVKDFVGNVRLAALIYGNLSPEEQRWMCDGLLQITQQIANEGYLTKYGVYTTEEKKRGCVVAFWPIQADHDGKFRVPRRFDDLVPKNFRPRTESNPEAAQC